MDLRRHIPWLGGSPAWPMEVGYPHEEERGLPDPWDRRRRMQTAAETTWARRRGSGAPEPKPQVPNQRN
ncbi:hypothetical protein M430DRAFT_54546 [Amorphotheca resinae ATCC 22711]|uniref:Uncharacterized protein n=1 Tax=Amorphotheca resinae ATCC 22711 TaxID=857342 RepID=A0A2T3AP94_AMORE|nr:hypothetical protein M430DRAFT_54546 [Amorphotheca resinae ATCC 22711]PSS06751.1 hypothetical protein M430DRAFT_54546 [Amorphotheca resinae ATCC 22711]